MRSLLRFTATSNYLQPLGLFDRHPTVADTEFLIDVFQVAFDGLCGDKELIGDLLVLQTLREQFQDIQFPVGQRFDQGLG